MKEQTLKRLMTFIMIVGLVLIVIAVYLGAIVGVHHTMGMQGIKIIAAFAGGGMLLLLPSKLFLTFLLMMNEKKE